MSPERPVLRGNAGLKRLAVRAVWMYLAAAGLAMILQGGPHPLESAGVLLMLAGLGYLVVAAVRRPEVSRLPAAIAANTLTAALVVLVAADQGWPPPALLINTVATGATVGLALGRRRPVGGLVSAGFAVAAMSLTGAWTGHPIAVLDLLSIPTSTAVASCIAVMASRGFVETEAALRGVDDALAAQRVASARWRAGRYADRDLHDTVLTTLTLLSHRDFAVEPEPVRELCARDLAFLEQDSWRSAQVPAKSPAHQSDARPSRDDAVHPWSSMGLEVHRLGQLDQLATLQPAVGQAVDAAVQQCLSNVAQHAGVLVAEVVISRRAGDLVVLIVDQGCGFDPDQVPDDRLGLADSVRGRITDLGGSVTVWSRPGFGTTVMLSVPVGEDDVESPADVAGQAEVTGDTEVKNDADIDLAQADRTGVLGASS